MAALRMPVVVAGKGLTYFAYFSAGPYVFGRRALRISAEEEQWGHQRAPSLVACRVLRGLVVRAGVMRQPGPRAAAKCLSLPLLSSHRQGGFIGVVQSKPKIIRAATPKGGLSCCFDRRCSTLHAPPPRRTIPKELPRVASGAGAVRDRRQKWVPGGAAASCLPAAACCCHSFSQCCCCRSYDDPVSYRLRSVL